MKNRVDEAIKANERALHILKSTPHDGEMMKEVFDAIAIHETCVEALQQAKANEWQPIETAPKDGTHILLSGYNYNKKGNPRWVCEGWYEQSEFIGVNEYEISSCAFADKWKPLPQPPQKKGE